MSALAIPMRVAGSPLTCWSQSSARQPLQCVCALPHLPKLDADQLPAVSLGDHGASQRRVLVADPDSSLLSVLSLVLPRYGINVETTSTAAEVLTILARQRPDVVVFDESLLHEDPDWLVRLGTDRLIVTVADSGSRHEQEAWLRGADACLPKPYAIDALLALLARPEPGPER